MRAWLIAWVPAMIRPKIETQKSVYTNQTPQTLKILDLIFQKNTKNFFKNYCVKTDNSIYYKGLCKAMKWEVTLL